MIDEYLMGNFDPHVLMVGMDTAALRPGELNACRCLSGSKLL